jgi:RNA polymerase sigma-70 factor (ECF subfamily)
MGPELLGQLIDRHGPALALYARQWCSAPEDVVQEAFLKLAALRTDPDRPGAWLYRAVRNGAISAGRSERRRLRHEGRAAVSPWFAPAEASRLDAAAAEHALGQLPVEEREVIVARLWGELTFDDIGSLTGTSAATAHRRYAEGLARLRERLGEPCPS